MRQRIALCIVLASACLRAQVDLTEQQSLQRALGEAGNSSVEFIRALENHLKQFPDTTRRADLEKALVKSAIDLNDDRRIIQYGESVLTRDPDNQQVLEHVTTALLHSGDAASAQRALEDARRFEQLIQAAYKNGKLTPGAGREEAKRKDEYDRGLARAKLLQARAQGLLGHLDEGIRLAESSYALYPSVEAARETARWLSSAGKDREAIQYLADAFTISALRSTDPEGAADRARMSALYQKLNGSDAGLGDLILKAYDSTSTLLAARRAALREYDPNAQLKDPMQFALNGLDGDKLKLSSLLGKVVVLDFWATWCVPCREQHALYERVKAKFDNDDPVAFISVNTDEDHGVVKPFLESVKWSQKVYFEDGLQVLLQVSSIPTTVIFGKQGQMVSKMIGFLPDRFVDMLTDRIDEALGKPPRPPAAPVNPLKGPISQ
jgi:thiol-disulfide isomerase/thioredoxin